MEAPKGFLEDLGEILGGLETSWGGFVTVWDGLEAVLGRSWGGLGLVLKRLGPSWRQKPTKGEGDPSFEAPMGPVLVFIPGSVSVHFQSIFYHFLILCRMPKSQLNASPLAFS